MLVRTVALTIILASAAAADEGSERAYEAVGRGEARPLAEILEQIGDDLDGEVVGVEFEREGKRYVYELKIITGDGQLLEVYVDARSGVVLSGEDD